MHAAAVVAVSQAAPSVVASHATVSSPDRVKPVSHANVATLSWSSVAENTTVPSLGADGAAEHEFTANVHIHVTNSTDNMRGSVLY